MKVLHGDLNAPICGGMPVGPDIGYLTISGETMLPLARPGDMAIIDLSRNRFEGDGLYAIRFDRKDKEPAVYRLLAVGGTPPKVSLSYMNPGMLVGSIVTLDKIEIVGRMVAVFNRM